MIARKISLTLLVAALLSACSTQEPEYVAQLLTLDELNNSAGYAWFPTETGLYTPDASMVSTVETQFTPNKKIYIYVRPSCSCKGTQKLFPQVMKTLIEANVDLSRVEIYSVRGTTDKHPYSDRITLTSLPAFYVFRDDTLRAFVDDRDYSGSNADTLMARAVGK